MQRDGGYSWKLTGTLALLLVLGSVSPAVAAESALSSRELRVQFSECGFEIGNPDSAATNPYVVLRDPGAALVRDADYRIVMAIVYRDAEAANAAHTRVHRQAEASGRGEYAVDRDFVACLEDVAPAGGTPIMPSIGPNFLPGQPW